LATYFLVRELGPISSVVDTRLHCEVIFVINNARLTKGFLLIILLIRTILYKWHLRKLIYMSYKKLVLYVSNIYVNKHT